MRLRAHPDGGLAPKPLASRAPPWGETVEPLPEIQMKTNRYFPSSPFAAFFLATMKAAIEANTSTV